ncbi:MAG TPA: DNA polymerase ligase N-terminal domain-containing protein [Thermoanaerobaculia bacterium]
MPLEEYRRKRRFDVTPEPSGKGKSAAKKKPTGKPKAKALHFVVQKHRASILHYDFRLEWKGVLLSWSVPKGPAFDPATKRLAMQVEDHPIEYAKFEGVIPEGEYGGGTVMIWDEGTWTPLSDDVSRSLEKGELKFELSGKKLRGSWVLVRTRPAKDGRFQWLLIKHRDDWVSKEDITELAPRSVVSNRLLAEIAFDEGGNVQKAATGDPPGQIEKLLKDPAALKARRPKRKPAVWHSKPRGS